MSPIPTPRELGNYAALAQIGMEMVLPAVFGAYVDDWLGTSSWLLIVFAVLGFAGGLVHLFAILRQKARDDSADKKPPP